MFTLIALGIALLFSAVATGFPGVVPDAVRRRSSGAASGRNVGWRTYGRPCRSWSGRAEVHGQESSFATPRRSKRWPTPTCVVVDKTGTLTEGKPNPVSVVAEGIGEQALLRLASGVETGSEHPLASPS